MRPADREDLLLGRAWLPSDIVLLASAVALAIGVYAAVSGSGFRLPTTPVGTGPREGRALGTNSRLWKIDPFSSTSDGEAS